MLLALRQLKVALLLLMPSVFHTRLPGMAGVSPATPAKFMMRFSRRVFRAVAGYVRSRRLNSKPRSKLELIYILHTIPWLLERFKQEQRQKMRKVKESTIIMRDLETEG